LRKRAYSDVGVDGADGALGGRFDRFDIELIGVLARLDGDGVARGDTRELAKGVLQTAVDRTKKK
jgi:hypothetical protein